MTSTSTRHWVQGRLKGKPACSSDKPRPNIDLRVLPTSPDPYELGNVTVDDIHIHGDNIISDYTLTAKRATKAHKKNKRDFIINVKFHHEQAQPFKSMKTALLLWNWAEPGSPEVTPEAQPGALEGIGRLYYANAYPVGAVVHGLYPIYEPDEKNLDLMWDVDLNCLTQRVLKQFEGAQRIWDEVCTVRQPVLERFLVWLDQKGIRVICCGEQGQPPPIAGDDWLCENADYYDEVIINHRCISRRTRSSRMSW